jgi:hypothetical protein
MEQEAMDIIAREEERRRQQKDPFIKLEPPYMRNQGPANELIENKSQVRRNIAADDAMQEESKDEPEIKPKQLFPNTIGNANQQ